MRFLLVIVVFSFYWNSYSQNTIQGTFPQLANQTIQLHGYNGFDSYLIQSVQADDKGVFIIDYFPANFGFVYLQSEDNKQFSLLLNNEKVVLEGADFETSAAIITVESFENKAFEQYLNEHSQREQTLAGWDYLQRIYQDEESLFYLQKEAKENILNERKRIQQEDTDYLDNLPKDSYVAWYLPIRKLISSVSTIAQYRTEEIPQTTAAFRKIDYSDNRLYKSGMLNDVLESQIWFIENSGYDQEEMYQQMNRSIDAILASLLTNEQRYNEIVKRLFNILEKRSLYTSSEYLAIKVLNEKSCTVNNDLAQNLEHYRAMKIGNIAPDIVFKGDLINPNTTKKLKKLSDISSKYTVLVFGASWCPACQQEFAHLSSIYQKWKAQNVEVVYISLDEDKQLFTNFTKIFPFVSYCDYKKWDSKAAQDYHIFATPTIYLLDNKRKIILRPTSIQQVDAWVDWYLVGEK